METLRHSSAQERMTLRSELAQSEENVRHLKDRVAVLERRTSADCVALGAPLSVDERVQGLLGERTLLERRLEEAHLHLADIKSSWSSKITSLETQVGVPYKWFYPDSNLSCFHNHLYLPLVFLFVSRLVAFVDKLLRKVLKDGELKKNVNDWKHECNS